jgi:multisite-specific tRNA:(cytosine-C5)-methyltransferase
LILSTTRTRITDMTGIHRERMVLPIWRSLHALNLMLPKEERRALLLRLFNDETQLVNTTRKLEHLVGTPDTPPSETIPDYPDHQDLEAVSTLNVQEKLPLPLPETEDEAIKHENIALGQTQQDAMGKRETYHRAGDEEDRFNTTM